MKKKKGYYYVATVLLFIACLAAGVALTVAFNLDRVGTHSGAGFAIGIALVLFAIPYKFVKKWLKPEEKNDTTDTTDTGSEDKAG